MHFVKVKGILSAHGGMNLYRGCFHGCIYCDSRSKCYQMGHDFEDIEIKENAIKLLEENLTKRRKKCMIGTGAMTDPYTPLFPDPCNMRRALELICKYGFGVTVHTKSDRVLEDIDLLKKINERTKAVVQMTLTTFDDDLCRKIEPNVCPTSRRREVLEILNKEGIPTVVWLSPILPYINDTVENISGII
ncbi:MAG: radical SAM protein, partial [Oscillospiraceae bacterium]|nr:radical SAM protein [Oscillospiraceae bacterium]